jgi:hypothetical protein
MSCVQMAAFSRNRRKRQWQSRPLPIIESLAPDHVTDCQKYPIMRNSEWRVVQTFLPVPHVVAINIDGLAGDVLTLFGGEEDGHGGDVLGLLPAVERHELLDLVGRLFLVRLALGYGLPLVPGNGVSQVYARRILVSAPSPNNRYGAPESGTGPAYILASP